MFPNRVTGKRCYWNVQGAGRCTGASGTGYNQSRRLLLENNRKAASGVQLGAEGSNPGKKKISARKQGLVIVMEGGGVVKYYRVNGTFSISSKDPFISINPA